MVKHALNVTRKENFTDWYQEVIKGAELAEMSGVHGCMIINLWICYMGKNSETS